MRDTEARETQDALLAYRDSQAKAEDWEFLKQMPVLTGMISAWRPKSVLEQANTHYSRGTNPDSLPHSKQDDEAVRATARRVEKAKRKNKSGILR
ncbi:hypothetical protein P7K49_023875 [Saguinus oedipus]|uniref:Uncharacterized protein n=1 Tax=Saguinus oedipus TaxID=9490 RepID=A0ABQ9UNN9_SAGOE|nr:hypothetical protein P7K49_023875 [Saguinus oedipus]